jgi:hypothetical protein
LTVRRARAGRSVYESAGRVRARRRRRRRLAAALVALVIAVVAGSIAVVFARGGGAGAQPRQAKTSPSPTTLPSASAATARATVLGVADVHRGEETKVRFRTAGAAGASVPATLVVLATDGERVKAQRLGPSASSPGVHTVTTRIDLPAGRYTCLVRLGDGSGPAVPAVAAANLRVLPPLPPAFPGRKAVDKALEWAAGRAGEVGVAVVDSRGDLRGLNEHTTFQGASLVKAMLLVAYLRSHSAPDASLDPVATKMIEESDNASAYAIYGVVGADGLKKVAKLAGMQDFVPGAGWVDARLSAADQARFFFAYERYVPASRRAFARTLLGGITPMQRWGIPAAAGPAGWTAFFKGGWLGMDNRLMLQAAWLEKGPARWALAVMTDENPDRAYGWDTQKGVTGLLLGNEPTPAYLATVLE